MKAQLLRDLREAIISALAALKMTGDLIVAFEWDNSSIQLLKLLIKEKVFDEKELLADIHFRLMALGRKSFDQHKLLNQFPDHTYSPHALAYAIQNGEFTEKERLSIKYDHGETESEFIKLYNSGDLKQHVLNQLLTERETASSSTDSDSTFCLCC